ncbi:MAG: hypothetical protein VX871_08190 [Pseudomonadota bacterium]|nr:hypothetical protein [Pseudomonadota bacterium]
MHGTNLKTLAALAGVTLLAMAAGTGASLACCKAQFERVKPHMNYSPPPQSSLPSQAQAQGGAPVAQTTTAAQSKSGGATAPAAK